MKIFFKSRMATAKSIGWAINAAGFVIWLFGYVSTGHAAAFDWEGATPRWISSFVPNLEAELGLALMFASMCPDFLARRTEARVNLARLFAYTVLLVFGAVTLAWWGLARRKPSHIREAPDIFAQLQRQPSE
jgi:hypothetical protein